MTRRQFMKLSAGGVQHSPLCDLPQQMLECPWVPWYAYLRWVPQTLYVAESE